MDSNRHTALGRCLQALPLVGLALFGVAFVNCSGSRSSVAGSVDAGADQDGAGSDAPGLEGGFDFDVVSEPDGQPACTKPDAGRPEAGADAGACTCPDAAPPWPTACSPATDCPYCTWGTCWGDCLDCVDAGTVWMLSCTE